MCNNSFLFNKGSFLVCQPFFLLYIFIISFQIDEKSENQGFEESRLPTFTQEESLEIQGSADFLGFNHYTSNLAYPTPRNEINTAEMGWLVDSDVTDFKDPTWYSAASKWLKVRVFLIMLFQ